jgi:anti-sigma factor RsiW
MMDGEDTRPMDDREREHPDEGTIHAWLDGALDDDAARAVAAHVATCRACAERVAEARGLIAGASRIVSALDDAPGAGATPWGQAPAAPGAPVATTSRRGWHMPRVTPARAAIAATVLVALGVSLTYERTAVDSQATRMAAERLDVPATGGRAAVSAPTSAPTAPLGRDPLLDSAVKRNVAAAQPPRAVEPAPGPTIPVPTMVPQMAVADSSAPARVAAGRAAVRAERDASAGVAPDQLVGRVGGVAVRGAEQRTGAAVAGAARVDTVATAPATAPATAMTARMAAPTAQAGATIAAECYRVESANDIAATWGVDTLPLVVRVESGGRAAVFTVAGRATGSSATVTRAGDDSLLLRLRRIGFEGTLALGAPGDERAGVMRSRPLEVQLSEVVTTAVPEAKAPAARRRVPVAKAVPSAAAPAEARSAVTAAPAVPVVARRVRCPG